MIRLENITKIYDENTVALNTVNLSFDNYGLHIITRKSGSGKSTLLNVISLLETIDKGNIIVDDLVISDLNNNEKDRYRGGLFSFIFQEYNLIENMTVKENLELCVYDKDYDEEDINNILKKVGLILYKDQIVSKLSGGERQRVAIARALVKNTKIILCNEPTGNLDDETGRLIMDLIKKISEDHLIILVTHNQTFAKEYSDRLIVIEEGKIIQDKYINNFTDKFIMNSKNLLLKNLKTFPLKNEVNLSLKNARKNIIKFIIFENKLYF